MNFPKTYAPKTGSSLVAVIGQGSIGTRHAQNLLTLGCQVIVCDPFQDQSPLENVLFTKSVDEALSKSHIAIIASPSSEHFTQARQALEYGCHVLLEKPFATTREDARLLLEYVRQSKKTLAVGMNLRFHPSLIKVRELIQSGAIGEPRVAHITFGSWLPGWRPGVDYRSTYSARAELGGGVLLDAIHEIDYLIWLFGSVGEVSTAYLGRLSNLEIDVEDTALFTLTHSSNVISTVALDYIDREYRRGCRIIGEEGTVEWSWRDEYVQLVNTGQEPVRHNILANVTSTYKEQTGAFLKIASDEKKIFQETGLCDAETGAEAVAIVDAIRSSHANKSSKVAVQKFE